MKWLRTVSSHQSIKINRSKIHWKMLRLMHLNWGYATNLPTFLVVSLRLLIVEEPSIKQMVHSQWITWICNSRLKVHLIFSEKFHISLSSTHNISPKFMSSHQCGIEVTHLSESLKSLVKSECESLLQWVVTTWCSPFSEVSQMPLPKWIRSELNTIIKQGKYEIFHLLDKQKTRKTNICLCI